MKKSISPRGMGAAGAACAAAVMLAACAGPTVSNDSDKSTSGGQPADAVDYSGVTPATEISFWSNHPGNSLAIEEELVAKFEKDTGIKVDLVTAGANYEEVAQKFQVAQVSGDAGDLVILSDANWFNQYLTESIVPIDPILAAAKESTDTYVETLFNDYEYEGSHYAVPFARSTPIFYYNKDAYKAAGLTDPPTTWEQVKEYSEILQKNNPADVPAFAFPSKDYYSGWTMANLVWGYGGAWSDKWDFSTLTDEGTVEALTFAQKAVEDGWAAVVSSDPPTVFSAGGTTQFIGSTGPLKSVLDTSDFEVGLAFLPGGPVESTNVVPTGGAGLAVSASSSPEKQLAAAMLAAYLTNSENTAAFSAATGYLPVRTDADMSTAYVDNPLLKIAVDQLANTRSQDYARTFVPGGDLAIATGLQSILTTNADVKTTMTGVQTELQKSFDRDLAARVK